MRRRLALMAVATTSMVLIAFLVPLAFLVRAIAADRAINAATSQAQSLGPLLAVADDRPAMTRTAASSGAATGRAVTVVLPDGSLLGSREHPPAPADVALARRGRSFVRDARGGVDVVQPVLGVEGGTAVIRVHVTESALRRGVTAAWAVLGLLGGVLLLGAVLVADRIARSVTRPTANLAGVARRLAAGDPAARVEPDGPPEVAEVGRALNLLADRIDVLRQAERESVADLPHRLRTPVTALRLDAEMLRDPDEAARVLTDVGAVERAVSLLIEEARRPGDADGPAAADLVAVARDRVGFWSILAEEQGRNLELELPDSPVTVGAPRADLEVALDALLANVFAHTPEGAALRVEVAPRGRGARLVVEDAGPGIADPDALERGAHGVESRGTGLGLDIVRRTAERSGGSVEISSSALGGARIVLHLGEPRPVTATL